MKVSEVLVKENAGYRHWCEGCKCHHFIPTSLKEAKFNWEFNGNVDVPTFLPSIKLSWGKDLESVCHYIITNGKVQFCDDCTHELKGQTVPLPKLPVGDY